jgi:threonyl-tRNA synthetase
MLHRVPVGPMERFVGGHRALAGAFPLWLARASARDSDPDEVKVM